MAVLGGGAMPKRIAPYRNRDHKNLPQRYLPGALGTGLRASACGFRNPALAGSTFLLALGFLASRLPRCLSPLPMVLHLIIVCWPSSSIERYPSDAPEVKVFR